MATLRQFQRRVTRPLERSEASSAVLTRQRDRAQRRRALGLFPVLNTTSTHVKPNRGLGLCVTEGFKSPSVLFYETNAAVPSKTVERRSRNRGSRPATH
jgi:hypothetical protein